MDPTWIPALVFLAIASLLTLGTLVAAAALRVRARDRPRTRGMTYECGEVPDGVAWIRFHPRYYVIALLFVLFDVETVFLLPWAVGFKDLVSSMGGFVVIVEAFFFVGILALGLVYVICRGGLEWD